uniref:Uncharacterized protein n=1 Tax=Molossus molossus TaxID=27622 RepID=A0A7J8I7X2_MOLMO|nr:hypothetical protein HJG59_010524 [Molossus molossus]
MPRNYKGSCDRTPASTSGDACDPASPLPEAAPKTLVLYAVVATAATRGPKNHGSSRDRNVSTSMTQVSPPQQRQLWKHSTRALARQQHLQCSAPGSAAACTAENPVATEGAVHTALALSWSHVQSHREPGSSWSETCYFGSSSPRLPPHALSSSAALGCFL